MKQTPKLREAGFDLTSFGTPTKFRKVLRVNQLKPSRSVIHKGGSEGYHYKYKTYVWKGKGLEMRTGNNPITGMYSEPKQRPPEKGYASYIGIKGTPQRVAKLVKTIKSTTRDIKGYNPKENEFIW